MPFLTDPDRNYNNRWVDVWRERFRWGWCRRSSWLFRVTDGLQHRPRKHALRNEFRQERIHGVPQGIHEEVSCCVECLISHPDGLASAISSNALPPPPQHALPVHRKSGSIRPISVSITRSWVWGGRGRLWFCCCVWSWKGQTFTVHDSHSPRTTGIYWLHRTPESHVFQGEGISAGEQPRSSCRLRESCQQIRERQDLAKFQELAILPRYGWSSERLTTLANAIQLVFFRTGHREMWKHRMSCNLLFALFSGEKMDPSGMCALMDYREDGCTPYMIFFKDGLIEEKVVSVLAMSRKKVFLFGWLVAYVL